MSTTKEKINAMKAYPSCAHISPPFLAGILEAMESHRIVHLGMFDSMAEGKDAAAEHDICADETISMIIFAINHGSYLESVFIIQNVYEDKVNQLLLSKNDKIHRGIFFTDATRTKYKEIGEWA